jgi:hypothetical protein
MVSKREVSLQIQHARWYFPVAFAGCRVWVIREHLKNILKPTECNFLELRKGHKAGAYLEQKKGVFV